MRCVKVLPIPETEDDEMLLRFRWGLLRSVNDLWNGPCRSATTGPHERFWSVQKVESGQYNRLIRWPFGKKVPSQQDPTEPL